MAEYIDRDAALDMELTVECGLSELEPIMRGMNIVFEHIRNLPTADVQQVKHGRWVDTAPNIPDWSLKKDGMSYYCSSCGHKAGKYKHKTYRYCPWCSAKMDGAR